MNTSTSKIATELVKRVSKRDITITHHHFKNKSPQKSTELSNHIWELKKNSENYTIDWLIAIKAHHTFVEGESMIYVCVKNY